MGSNPIPVSFDSSYFFRYYGVVDRDPRGGHNRKQVNENFFEHWSPEMAYVLGFIYADGTIEDCRKSSRTCYLQLSNNDRDLLEQIRESMSSNHILYHRNVRKIEIRGKTYVCKESYNLRIGNKKIYIDLQNYGLKPRKSLTIELPEIPKKYFSFFLRGYFDGDGCVNTYQRKSGQTIQVIFTSGSFVFLERLNEMISDLLRIKPKNIPFQSGAFRLAFRANEAISVCKFIYKNLEASPFLKKKYGIYQKYLTSRN